MSYVEAIENATPTQARLHRERMERLRRFNAKAMPDHGVQLVRPRGVDGIQMEKLRQLRREAAVERAKQEAAAQREAEIMARIEAANAPREVVVSDVDIIKRPAVVLDELEEVEATIPLILIKRIVCQRYRLKMSELLSPHRTLNIVMPRQIAMYLCRRMASNKSLPRIGAAFGGRDHTTVLHAIRKIEKKMAEDEAFSAEVQGLIQTIEAEA
jgi:chromosomal replication initiation ATPase DnaA